MYPHLKGGDYVLCWRWPRLRVKLNDVVVIKYSESLTLIKRVVALGKGGSFKIAGENESSAIYEQWFSSRCLVGKVIFTMSP